MPVGPDIPAGSVVTRSYFYAFVPHLGANVRGTGYSMTLNRFVAGSWAFTVAYQGLTVDAGQVTDNWFDGSIKAYMTDVTEDVLLGGNYWEGGTGDPPVPEVHLYAGENRYKFATALSAVPSMCGPTW